jgi:hypothetical protein
MDGRWRRRFGRDRRLALGRGADGVSWMPPYSGCCLAVTQRRQTFLPGWDETGLMDDQEHGQALGG